MYPQPYTKQSIRYLANSYQASKKTTNKDIKLSKPSSSFYYEVPPHPKQLQANSRSKKDKKTIPRPQSSLADANSTKINPNIIINQIEKNVGILKNLYKSSVSSLTSEVQKDAYSKGKSKKANKISHKNSKQKSSKKITPRQNSQTNISEKNANIVKNEQKNTTINEPKQYNTTNLFEIYKFYKSSIDSSIARTKDKKGVQSLKTSAKNSMQKKNQTMTAVSKPEKNAQTPSDSISSFRGSKNNSTMVSKKLGNSLEEEQFFAQKLFKPKQQQRKMKKKPSFNEGQKSKKCMAKTVSKAKKSKGKDGKKEIKKEQQKTKKKGHVMRQYGENQAPKKRQSRNKMVNIEQNGQKFEFPQIQSSVFDANLPVLEQEPSNAEQSRTCFNTDKTGILNITEQRHTKQNDQRIPTSQQIQFSLQQSLALQRKLNKKKSSELDSLQSCEIPKRDSDNSYLDNIELISIQL